MQHYYSCSAKKNPCKSIGLIDRGTSFGRPSSFRKIPLKHEEGAARATAPADPESGARVRVPVGVGLGLGLGLGQRAR